jgi:hypothetical protein
MPETLLRPMFFSDFVLVFLFGSWVMFVFGMFIVLMFCVLMF